MYTIKQISEIAGVSTSKIYHKIRDIGINYVGFIDYKRVYSVNQLSIILDAINSNEIIRYYPMKTTETFYIYESKMNKT